MPTLPAPSTEPDGDCLPIDTYGVIGNDDRCALVGNGSIDWCCFPHLESPAVFAAILDTEAGGRFAIQPTASGDDIDIHTRYLEGTNILETRFETADGVATVTDFMPVRRGESTTGYSDESFQQAIYRLVEGKAGSLELGVHFEPRFDYGRSETTVRLESEADGVAETDNEVETGGMDGEGDTADTSKGEQADDPTALEPAYLLATGERADERLTLHSDAALQAPAGGEDEVSTAIEISAGDTARFCLQYGGPTPNIRSCEDYDELLVETVDYWRTWLEGCADEAGGLFAFESEWREVLRRSALVLKLLIHGETGAIAAAPTASLPEEIGGELNWDYRYNWIRDAKFTVQALYNVGQRSEAKQYFEWFREIGHRDPTEIQPLYGLHGETEIGEDVLEHLEGYRGSRPVRIGNAAAEQEQLDIYGTIVQGIYETVRYEDGLTDYDWESVCGLANYVCEHWEERDKSIWEFRDLHEHFVHSKLLCWVALDRAVRLALEYDRGERAQLDRWKAKRDLIRAAIEDRGYDEETGSFVQYFGADGDLDATALLIPLYDFLPPEDERVQNTIDTVLEELTTDDGFVFRFANSAARPREPGGFVLCSFWLVDALVLSGRLEEARELFAGMLEYASPLGLYSEMIHAEDGTFLGNYPQAFSHIGLLNSALYLASATEEGLDLPMNDCEHGAGAPLFRRHG